MGSITGSISTQAAISGGEKHMAELKAQCLLDSQGHYYARATSIFRMIGGFLLCGCPLIALLAIVDWEFFTELDIWLYVAFFIAGPVGTIMGLYFLRLKYTFEDQELVCRGLLTHRFTYARLQAGAQEYKMRHRAKKVVLLKTDDRRTCHISYAYTRGGYHLLYLLEERTGIVMFEAISGMSRGVYDPAYTYNSYWTVFVPDAAPTNSDDVFDEWMMAQLDDGDNTRIVEGTAQPLVDWLMEMKEVFPIWQGDSRSENGTPIENEQRRLHIADYIFCDNLIYIAVLGVVADEAEYMASALARKYGLGIYDLRNGRLSLPE